jgi:hypothetical protein
MSDADRNALLVWARQLNRPFTMIEARRAAPIEPKAIRDALADLIRLNKIRVNPQPRPFAAKHEVNP